MDPTTIAKRMREGGFPLKARRPREKPLRKPEHEELRVAICKKWKELPASYFANKVDMIIDNKVEIASKSFVGQDCCEHCRNVGFSASSSWM